MVAKEIKKPHFFDHIFSFRFRAKTATTNLIVFIVLIWVLIAISDPRRFIADPDSLEAIAYTVSPLLWFIYFLTLLDILFPLRALGCWIFKNLLLTCFLGISTILTFNQDLIEGIVNFWSALLLKPTLDLALMISKGVGLKAYLLPDGARGPIFGTDLFTVEIWPGCAGYEGMALIISLLAVYCYLQRDILHVFRALLIIPLASVAMFFLNALRIIILIAIGHFYSPRLALDGFHVVGGWLNLLLVFVVSLGALNSVPWFLKNPQKNKADKGLDLPFLSPLVSLILLGLFSKIFTSNFDWLYPVPILFSALILFYYREWYKPLIKNISFLAYASGALIFLIWVYLVPIDQAQNQNFFEQIQIAPLWAALSWLVFRVIGATIIVPIVEELAFRGFLLPRLQIFCNSLLSQNALLKISSHHSSVISTLLALILSSILFGVLHSDVLAGSLAGFGFGMIYLYRRKLVDAIMAHAVTNALLAIDVVYFGNWSYW